MKKKLRPVKVELPEFKCSQCGFTTTATTPKGLIAALKRHRRDKPSHRRLVRIPWQIF